MKRKLLSLAVALLCSVVTWAVTGSALTNNMTDVFLYNVGAGKYLTAGDWWGTHATISTAGMDLDLTKVSDGVYTIGTRQEGSKFMSGVWMDGSSVNYTFTEVDPTNHYYTISWVDNETTNYVYYTGSTVDATADTPNGNAFYWQVVTRTDFLASLSGATSASPKDATAAIYNAGFFVFDYATKKNTDFPASRSWQGTKLTDTWGYRLNEAGNASSNYCVEQAGKSFDNYQSLTGLPNGVYVLKNQGFYRGDKATYLYANDQKVAQTKITSVYDAPDGYTGNDLQRSSYAIGIMDMYHNQTPNVLVTDGNLRIGVTSNGESIDWSLFDNFKLYYYGNAVEVYDPEAFTSNSSATADKWYELAVSAGWYRIESSAAATLYYTQNGSDDADAIATSKAFTAGGYTFMNLSAGSFFFKSSETSTIKIEAISSSVLQNGDVVTDVFITNPSFSSAYTTGWTVDGTAPNDYNSTYGAYEAYHRTGGLHQDLTGLPNGIYKVTMQATSRIDGGSSGTFNLFATTNNGTTKSPATIASHTNFATMAQAFHDDATYARIETYAVVTDGNLTIGHYESNDNTWPVFDNYTLTYYGTSSEAYALALASEAAKASTSITGMTDGALKTALNSAYTERNAEATLANIQWMTFISSSASELSQASNLSIAANAIANVTYTETTDGSHTTFASAISTFNTTVAGASSVETITSAISTLKTAIKTYIKAAEPTNEGEYFDITCLIENPSFDNNTTTGWTYTKTGGANAANYTCNEFFNNTFDFYQNLTGLANGSYQLTVQAYSRPGDNGNATSGAYKDYKDGTNNVTAELYVNSDASRVGNIYAYKGNTTGAKVDGNDFHCNISPDDYWVPNNMQGASLYFADEDVYKTEVAALVEDGNLKIGFRDNTLTTNQWTIFDNFHLYYYGSSKLVYYQQYLPQLRAEVSEDLNNGAYANVLVSSEDEALDAALAADPASETEEAYETVIDNLRTAQTNFRAAATPYNAIVAERAASAMTKISENVGTGVFQYNESTNNSLYSAYETARASVTGYTFTTSSTASGAQTLLDALNEAVENYNNQTLNAPVEGQRIKIVNCTASSAFDFSGNALTFYENPSQTEGGYSYQYRLAPNNAYAQNFIFTPVAGQKNQYIMSFIDNDGTTRYVCTQYGYNGNASGDKTRIRTTTNSEYALKVRVDVTTTANVWKLYNTEAGKNIGTNGKNNNDFFTNADRSDLTLSVAEKASVTVSCKAGKYGTVIFPFTPDVSEGFDGITFYSINGINNETSRVLIEETTPVANTPYIVRNASGDDFSKAVTGWGAAYKDSYDSGDTDIKLTGVYTAATIAASAGNTTNYVLQTPTSGENEGIQAFYKVDADFTATANKCYLTVTAAGVKAFFLDFSDTDAINSVEAIQNDNTVIYNLAGQRVQKAQKGLYIVNGKKVVIK